MNFWIFAFLLEPSRRRRLGAGARYGIVMDDVKMVMINGDGSDSAGADDGDEDDVSVRARWIGPDSRKTQEGGQGKGKSGPFDYSIHNFSTSSSAHISDWPESPLSFSTSLPTSHTHSPPQRSRSNSQQRFRRMFEDVCLVCGSIADG